MKILVVLAIGYCFGRIHQMLLQAAEVKRIEKIFDCRRNLNLSSLLDEEDIATAEMLDAMADHEYLTGFRRK
jgi:hypothetical protein